MDPLLPPLDHEELYVRRGPRSGLPTIVAVHSTARGPALGGCRVWNYDDPTLAARDALRLARAMTYKAACADQPLGGGKGVIALPPGLRLTGRRRRAALLDFGETVEQLAGRYVTAEDVGIGSRDMPVIAQTTSHVSGLARSRGGSGDPSPFTALGVETAIRTTCARVFGDASLAGRSIAIVGLGHVGSRVAARCARAGARLLLADVDPAKRALADELGARWTTPARALTAKVDLLSPCALGGFLDEAIVPRLRCRAIAGAANNQLATDAVAGLLAMRGILWAPDFVVSAGGIVNIAVELEPGGYDAAVARRRVRAIGATLDEIFSAAEAQRTTPLAAAVALGEQRLAAV
ncbi:Glu/Leu/Phe/Val dehydrogenase dimerization domain-containing protein [Conexibacter woesei]|uniref:Glu/Leu/Phe/Val dehydrogenase dimerization region n=1 Tax=Conexibacter woesei (strain DSM 14684 / CCUG 47730 / CIP 108061 / JCM 11494 / NBRC 100937 / ID131577) TaxID=469383 RepID=D3EZZ7_CONWI|nr:Glu/Leu/Phe/Val dehydrogenase dimerization domain-containing protein [Conexibacter woesei]ADB49973.1 Glu/Leu/Phe/Val dehydrogenase dimerization region [Conexibacter woesei DSM 14684]